MSNATEEADEPALPLGGSKAGGSPRKRGPKLRPPEELALARRKNVSLDAEAQESLVAVAETLEKKMGFRPTLTQTVMWLVRNSQIDKP
jgi:hypothetical protein